MKLGPLIRQYTKLTEQIQSMDCRDRGPINTQSDFNRSVAMATQQTELEKRRESIGRAIERLRNNEGVT